MEITLLAGLICNPVFNQIIAWSPAGRKITLTGGFIYSECSVFLGCHQNTAAVAISTLLSDMIVSLMLWQFYKTFKGIRSGDIFNQQQITRIAVAGWCFISLSIYSLLSDMFLLSLQSTSDEVKIGFQSENFIYIPVGIGLVILSYVLKLATEIKEDQELVI